MIGALALNCGLVWLLFSSIESQVGLLKGALFNFVFMVCLMATLPGVVTGFWMPYLYVIPFTCYVYALALLHTGKLHVAHDKLIFFFSLGLIIHGHASFIGLSLIGFFASIFSTYFTRQNNLHGMLSEVASLTKPRLILLIPLIFVFPILTDAFVNFPGEFPSYVRFTRKVAHNELVDSIRFALRFFPGGPRMVPLFLGALGIQYFFTNKLLRQNQKGADTCDYRQNMKLSLSCFLLTFMMALIYAYRGIDGLGKVNYYTLFWTSGGYSLAVAFMINNLVILVIKKWRYVHSFPAHFSPRTFAACSAAIMMLTFIILSPADQGLGMRDPSVEELSGYIVEFKNSRQLSTVRLDYTEHMQWPLVAGLLLDLERKNIASCTTWRHMQFLYTDKLTCPLGAEWDIKLLPVDQCGGNCSHASGLTGIAVNHTEHSKP